MVMDINYIIMNSDTNYIVGFIVVLLSAKILHDRETGNKNMLLHRRSRTNLIIQNIFFAIAILIIAGSNLTLAAILTILFISINV